MMHWISNNNNKYLSPESTWVKARDAQVFLPTNNPNLAFPLTIQYGTPIFLHRAGRKRTT